MAKVYVADTKNDALLLVAWINDYQERTGDVVEIGRDGVGDFIEVSDSNEAVFAKLKFG